MSNEIPPVKTILVLSANPKGTNQLDLAKEIRDIKEGLQLSEKRGFKVESAEAAHYRDISRSILKHKPHIVHFSGHGKGQEGLIFEDNQLVDAEALAGLFELFANKVECVLLNACYSEVQAKAIAQHINYVIGMNQAIGDKAAIEFAVGFYDALGDGQDVEFAYKLGCIAIRIAGISEHLTPQLLRKGKGGESINITLPPTSLPLDDRGELNVVSPLPATPSTHTAPREEKTNIIQYRQQVEEFADDGVISDEESHILNDLQRLLGLTDEQVSAVEKKVLEPYENYKRLFTNKIAAQGYPLGEKAEAELNKVQKYYKIPDEYVISLKQDIEQEEAEKKQIIKTHSFEFETATLGKNHEILRSGGRGEFFAEDLGNGVMLEMVSIPGGSFKMGSPESEAQRESRESPQHNVTIQPFFMGKFTVTQEQYQAVMGENPSQFKGGKKPVESVTWDNAVEFCAKISKIIGKVYRLPSEAEWEYACRAGTTNPFYFGETITTDLANYDGNHIYGSAPKGQYRKQTMDVGSFPANAFGLYDMHGNVWEWCQDNLHENYEGAPDDGTPWSNSDNSYRLLRGGSWSSNPRNCRCAFRAWHGRDRRNGNIGFRVVFVCPRTP
jgi:formylglycine-generating enzyme required for sulfatase activity